MYASIPLAGWVVFQHKEFSDTKFIAFLSFIAALFGIREIGKTLRYMDDNDDYYPINERNERNEQEENLMDMEGSNEHKYRSEPFFEND